MNKKEHAILSPSSAFIWLHCTYHLQLKQRLENEVTEEFHNRKYGQAMHEFTNQILSKKKTLQDFESTIDREDFILLRDIISFMKDRIKKDSVYYTEEVFKYNDLFFGKPDLVFFDWQNIINIVDFKFGEQKVRGKGNAQLLMYAFLFFHFMESDYDQKYIKTWIYQPRIQHIDSDVIPIQALDNLKPKLDYLIDQVENKYYRYKIGNWCEMCIYRGYCKYYKTEFIDQFKLDAQYSLTNIQEIEDTLDKLKKIESFTKKYRDAIINEITHKRLFLTRYYKTYKKTYVIKNTYKDKLQASLRANGFELYDKKEKTVAALKRELSGSLFHDLLEPYIEVKVGAPFLRRKEIQDD